MLSADGTYNYHGFNCLSEQGQGKGFCIVPEIWNKKKYTESFFYAPLLFPKMGVYKKKA
jgi:hypothetical protein